MKKFKSLQGLEKFARSNEAMQLAVRPSLSWRNDIRYNCDCSPDYVLPIPCFESKAKALRYYGEVSRDALFKHPIHKWTLHKYKGPVCWLTSFTEVNSLLLHQKNVGDVCLKNDHIYIDAKYMTAIYHDEANGLMYIVYCAG